MNPACFQFGSVYSRFRSNSSSSFITPYLYPILFYFERESRYSTFPLRRLLINYKIYDNFDLSALIDYSAILAFDCNADSFSLLLSTESGGRSYSGAQRQIIDFPIRSLMSASSTGLSKDSSVKGKLQNLFATDRRNLFSISYLNRSI